MLLAFHAFLAVGLFLTVNWLGHHARAFGYHSLSLYDRVEEAQAFNLLYRILAPQVFLVLCAALFAVFDATYLAQSMWRITALYFLVRWGFNLLMGRGILVAWSTQIPLAFVTIGLSYGLSRYLLQDLDVILPAPRDLSSEVWLIVILFLYHTVNKITAPGTLQERRQRRFLTKRYAKLKGRYHGVIRSLAADPWIEALAYAILIYEDFNRPALARAIESHILFPLGLAKTLGPMQVTTASRLDDPTGVRLGVERIVGLYPDALATEDAERSRMWPGESGSPLNEYQRASIARRVAAKYNPDKSYADEVKTLYVSIIDTFYAELKPVSEGAA